MDTPAPLPRTVGSNVAAAITLAGQTTSGVAQATGIPRTTLIRHLKGRGTGFTVSQLETLGLHLHVDPIIFLKAR